MASEDPSTSEHPDSGRVCVHHPDQAAVARCHECGAALCGDCVLKDGTQTICAVCLDNRVPLETLAQKDVRLTRWAAYIGCGLPLAIFGAVVVSGFIGLLAGFTLDSLTVGALVAIVTFGFISAKMLGELGEQRKANRAAWRKLDGEPPEEP